MNRLDDGNGGGDDDLGDGDDGHGGGVAGKVSKSDKASEPVLPPSEEHEHYKEGTPGDGKVYLNNIGELVKIDKIGRPYKIGKDGRKTFRESPRPVDKYTPEEWQRLPIADRKVIKKMQQREKDKELAKAKAAREAKAKSPAKKKDPDKDDKGDKGPSSSSTSKGKKPSVPIVWSMAPNSKYLHMHGIVDEEGKKEVNYRNHHGHVSAASPCSDDSTDVPDDEEYLMEWDEWSEASMLKEWKGLRDQGVFDFSMVREYDDVVREAKKNKEEVHMARVHGICVEKNYQLPQGDVRRKFKGRGVLLGNQVKNQNWEAAFFQDLGNSPASFEASRWADFYGCLPGHDVKLADALQAYIQAKLTGPLCWVEIPTDAWPPGFEYWKFRGPVVRLDKALYGHPDSGTMWEKHCDTQVRTINFQPIGEEWPSMYFHPELKLLLVIYVDDLKLAGPEENLAKGWELLRSVLRIEPETDLGLYLGCVLSKGESKLHDGTKVKTFTYNMEGLLKLSVEKYLENVGKDTKLKKVSTPSLPEETKNSPYRAPVPGGKTVQCPWCAHQFDPAVGVSYGPPDSSRDVPLEANREP
eukprot:s184_g23.t1